MKIIQLYSIPNCPYCERAKALLKHRNLSFEEVKVDRNDASQISALVARSKMRTFPQIFAGEVLIGGFTELEALDQAGKLMGLVE